jgi:hypothetical protein
MYSCEVILLFGHLYISFGIIFSKIHIHPQEEIMLLKQFASDFGVMVKIVYPFLAIATYGFVHIYKLLQIMFSIFPLHGLCLNYHYHYILVKRRYPQPDIESNLFTIQGELTKIYFTICIVALISGLFEITLDILIPRSAWVYMINRGVFWINFGLFILLGISFFTIPVMEKFLKSKRNDLDAAQLPYIPQNETFLTKFPKISDWINNWLVANTYLEIDRIMYGDNGYKVETFVGFNADFALITLRTISDQWLTKLLFWLIPKQFKQPASGNRVDEIYHYVYRTQKLKVRYPDGSHYEKDYHSTFKIIIRYERLSNYYSWNR